MATTEETVMSEPAGTRFRSPPYPFVSLPKAIDRAKAIGKIAPHFAVPLASVANAWGTAVKSSSTLQTVGALMQFGLIADDGAKDNRKLKLTKLGEAIALDTRPHSADRDAAIRSAALEPPIFREIWETYQTGNVDEHAVAHDLTLGRRNRGVAPFSDTAAREVARLYRETVAFAKLSESDKIPGEAAASRGGEPDLDRAKPEVSVGAKIQWTSNGVDQFREPATVTGVSDDGNWLWTDQGQAGIRMSEVEVVDFAGEEAPPPPPSVLAALAARVSRTDPSRMLPEQYVLSQGKLRDGSFEVRVTGEIGAREIGKIIKVLKAQQSVLADDDDDENDSPAP